MSERWTVTNSAYAMDGGSIYLELRDPAGRPHSLHVPQHVLPTNFTREEPPGALILDGAVLRVRGSAEADLIVALRSATYEAPAPPSDSEDRIAPAGQRLVLGEDVREYVEAIDQGPIAAMRQLVERVLSFVESDEFVSVARRHGRAP